jgi:hypothetical protein
LKYIEAELASVNITAQLSGSVARTFKMVKSRLGEIIRGCDHFQKVRMVYAETMEVIRAHQAVGAGDEERWLRNLEAMAIKAE